MTNDSDNNIPPIISVNQCTPEINLPKTVMTIKEMQITFEIFKHKCLQNKCSKTSIAVTIIQITIIV